MSQINPTLLASLAAAANGQANLPGPVTDENGQPIESARAGKTNLSDFLSHAVYGQGSRQAPTSAMQVRHQGPVGQAMAPQSSGDTNAGDPTADEQRQAMGTYNIPTSANESRRTMQVPQWLLNSDQFRSEMDNAKPGEHQAIVDRWMQNSQTDVDKQQAAYDAAQNKIRTANAQHPLTQQWTTEVQNGPQHSLTTFQPQNTGANLLQGQPSGQPGGTVQGASAATPAGVSNVGAGMFKPGGSATTAPPWATTTNGTTTWTDQQITAANNATQLANSLGLNPDQVKNFAAYAAMNPHMPQSELLSAGRDMQKQNADTAAAGKESNQQAREDWNAQRDIYKADYESAQRDYDAAQKAFDTAQESPIGMANPASLDPLKTNVGTAKTAMDTAKKQWSDFTKAGPKIPYAPVAASQRGLAMQGMMPGSSATYKGQQYQTGQTVTGPDGRKYQIVGFASDGEPQLQPIR